MSRAVAFTLVLCGAVPADARQQALEPFKGAAADRAKGPPQVLLVYREQEISDRARAALVRLVAESIRTESWQPIKPTNASDVLERIIDDFYDYFSKGDYAAPLTVQALRKSILDKNEGIRPDQLPPEIRIPPFPMRGLGELPPETRIVRVFNAQTHGYSLHQDPYRIAVPIESAAVRVDDRDQLVASYRKATLTGILLPLGADLRKALRSNALPSGVLALSGVATGEAAAFFDPGIAQIELLDVARGPNCPFDASAAGASRYTVPAVDAARRRLMLAEAEKMPLVIMDVGFAGNDQGHHGTAVRRVAEKTASDLGFDFLITDRTFKSFDLFPTDKAVKDRLTNLVTAYVARGPERLNTAPILPYVAQAKLWIEKADELLELGPPKFNVPDLLLRAALWEAISNHWWLNLSFRAKASVLDLLPRPSIEKSRGFVVSAVGNESVKMAPGYVPQDGAQAYKSFVTVTFGTSDGQVKGEHSDHDTTTPSRVFVMGRGCFDGIDREGSSLASPVVAVSAWIRRLLELTSGKTPPALSRLRQEIMRAAKPLPNLDAPVESMGFFDPRRLLDKRPPHLVAPDATITPLSDFRLEASCSDRDKGVFVDSAGLDNGATATILAIGGSDDEPFLWRGNLHLVPSLNDASTAANVCKVTDLRFTANGGSISFTDLKSFRAAVQYIDW